MIMCAVFGVLLIVAIAAFGKEIDHHLDAIEAWLRAIGPWGTVAFIAIFVVFTSLMVPTTVLSLIAGALFGPGWGTLAVVVGALAAAPFQYFVAHRVLRVPIMRRLSSKPSLLARVRAVERHGLRLQVMLRLSPLSPAMGSYLLGAAGVPFWGFFVACFALIPGLFLEVYFGHAGRHLTRMAGSDGRGLEAHGYVLIGGLVVGLVVMALVSRMASKALRAASADADA